MTDRRTAIVTGASAGLGYGSAAALAARGDDVVIASRTAERITAAAEALDADAEGTVTGVAADVSDPASATQLVQAALDAHGRLDVLVANTGGPAFGPALELDDDALRAAFDDVLLPPLRLIREALPAMREQGYGRIVIVGSSSIRRPIPNLALSNVMRPALVGYVKTLATEIAAEGITVNLAAPGRVNTARVQAGDEAAAERRGISVEEVRTASASSIPAKRYGTVEEFGALVAFLTSQAASYVTGQTFMADGGMVPTLP